MKENKVIKKILSGKGVYPYRYAFALLIPFRSIFLSSNKLIKYLNLKEDDVVLELGSGPGYFSKKIAKFLKSGKLILADIQKEMLTKAKKRINKAKLNNVEYYLCDGKSFEFPDNYFDKIFMLTVIGEVENKNLYFKEFFRILKNDGILSFSEQAGDPDKMKISEIKDLSSLYNFEFYKLFGTENNYTINFKKKN